MRAFAKLFETAAGQILVTTGDAPGDEGPFISFSTELEDGSRVSTKATWPETDDGYAARDAYFQRLDKATAITTMNIARSSPRRVEEAK